MKRYWLLNNLEVEYVDINSIKPYKNNAKQHPKEQIEQIKKSIEEFGMIDPIGVWNNEIVEGHGRLIACEQNNRNCYVMELEPKWVDVIIARWENFTGQKAIKIN